MNFNLFAFFKFKERAHSNYQHLKIRSFFTRSNIHMTLSSLSRNFQLFTLIVSLLTAQLLSCHGDPEIPFTFLDNAIPKRAVCIVGTRAGYYHALGSGDGIDNWMVYLEGGGWCTDYSKCQRRSKGFYGSTKHMKPMNFSGILSSNKNINPDFYNWNRVFAHYCEGSSFMGDISITQRRPHLQLRGSRIFNAVINELLEKGMRSANNGLLVGGSAGGLAAILNCDKFRARLSNVNTVKCVSDAGFFIRARNVSAAHKRERRFDSVVTFHNLRRLLPKSCTSKMRPGLCLFPENLVEDIKTPLFLLNSVFDSVQIQKNLKPNRPCDVNGWKECTENLSACTRSHRRLIKDFGNAFLGTLMSIGEYPSRGVFINARYAHTYTEFNEMWNSKGSPRLGNKTNSQAIGDWYFDRSRVKLIDTNTHFPFN